LTQPPFAIESKGLTTGLAPHVEVRKTGTIIGVGSVAGDRRRIKNYVCGSAKAGLHTYLAGARPASSW